MIKIENLVKKYDNGFTENVIFNGFDVAIEDGEFVAIHGRSGCGKSTLLNIIGLIDSMSEGTYILDGKDISKLKPSEYAAIRNRDIGFIFQAFHLLQDESVIYNVSLPMKYAKVDKASRKERAEALLKLVGLEGKENNKALQLSGGEMQRVAIARALANNPKYILADEPTGNLDIENRDIIMDLLKTINEKNGSTIIMVTHDEELLKYADRVINL
ncbi:ABC transporter ATP-binding protein [Mogibacterium diversum]|jgi:macrolide export ATP-binding/permease protein macB|uniref:ABC transporter ATP-binding protein n=1 Tax=Mogibacterium diversum TaxID=114527 RepID=UPI0026393DE5|nr:ABC transporter ATP-binding protein [Mogibacterium diversum]